jgi:hypothetical protein
MPAGANGIKRCVTCNKPKSPTDFWKDKNRPDGRYPICRECERPRNQRRYLEVKHTETYRQNHAKRQRRYSATHKNVIRAHYAVRPKQEALRKTTCESCGTSKAPLHMHHPNYNQPLEVITLCVPCHESIHHGGPIL